MGERIIKRIKVTKSSGLTITLPSEVVKSFNIVRGDYLNLVADTESKEITLKKDEDVKLVEFDDLPENLKALLMLGKDSRKYYLRRFLYQIIPNPHGTMKEDIKVIIPTKEYKNANGRATI